MISATLPCRSNTPNRERQRGNDPAGSVLVASIVHNYAAALITMIVFACIGLIAAILIPSAPVKSGTATQSGERAEA